MTESDKTIALRLPDYQDTGLYLILKGLRTIELTRKNIEAITAEYWTDPRKIPQHIKDAMEFQRCTFCPMRKIGDFCDALRPVLPLLDVVDDYASFQEVTAIYKATEAKLYHIADTTMQQALRYISTLSITGYCQVGGKYLKYFSGILPIMNAVEIANRLYLNMYWIHGGDKKTVDKVIAEFNEAITHATQNQAARLRLICKNDAFVNAFALTQVISEVLYTYKDTKLKEAVRSFEADRGY